ncbi:5-oxoprolinase subunit PxpA [Niallia oryzisoli]|uniref:5-oxoprolinase subunit PxpA n=1 Tax=Niallia oryzisoli TaxID=1737571 RepID=UPI003734DC3D
MYTVDLNCDMGESFGIYEIGSDEEILDYITSANIACGFHAGDPATMRRTVQLALSKGVGIGVHPGFQDLVGFGRREMKISPLEAYDIMIYQIGSLYGFAKAEGAKLQHVKPHGALYNMAAKDPALAEAIAEAIYKIDPELILYGLAGSKLIDAGRKIGLRTANEVFADRTYQEDGSLTPRTNPNALITDSTVSVKQVITLVKEGRVRSLQGTDVFIQADTVCIHGDGREALEFAKTLSEALKESGIKQSIINHNKE